MLQAEIAIAVETMKIAISQLILLKLLSNQSLITSASLVLLQAALVVSEKKMKDKV